MLVYFVLNFDFHVVMKTSQHVCLYMTSFLFKKCSFGNVWFFWKALAWEASNKFNNAWSSILSKDMKVKLFQATVERVLYGCETWTVTNKNAGSDLWMVYAYAKESLNINWKVHMTNRGLYSDRPKINSEIRKRRLQFAWPCKRSDGTFVSDLVTCQPTKGRRSTGRPVKTYVDLLHEDTGL